MQLMTISRLQMLPLTQTISISSEAQINPHLPFGAKMAARPLPPLMKLLML